MEIGATPLSAPDKLNGKVLPKGLWDPIGMTQPQWILMQQKPTLSKEEITEIPKNRNDLEVKDIALDANRRDI